MSYQDIIYEQRGRVAWIYLNRPKAMNSINTTMTQEIIEALAKAQSDDQVRVLVLSAKGPVFCAGADLKGVQASMAGEIEPGPDFLDFAETMFRQLRNFPKPVIVALNGLTMAGGLELTMACDLVIAAKSAKIGDSHSNFGVFPGAGGACVLPRKIGLNRAKYLLFTGDMVSAQEMKDFGLVNEVVDDEALEDRVQTLAKKLSDKSPLVLRKMKEVANQCQDQSQEAALRHELFTLRTHFRSFDIREGLSAFVEKRKPEFTGK
jgi:enoyl-CoA hydratase